MKKMKLSILVIAEAANPDWVSVPLVGWSLANALRDVAEVHIVTQIRNRDAILNQGLLEGHDFTVIDSEALDRPLYKLANFLRGGKGKGWTTVTAFKALSYYYFEYLFWKRFGKDIRNKKYDIVHRITPLSPTIPSVLAKKCHSIGVPFILGPLNGGVPWPVEFNAERRKEKEWLSYVRGAYKYLPGYKNTLKYSSAIVVGSKDTLKQLPIKHRDKCIRIPENAIDLSRFSNVVNFNSNHPFRVCFVGRLVPYKCPDILLEAAMPLIKKNKIEVDIIGDGPLMNKLKEMLKFNNISSGVRLLGWVEHAKIQKIMCESQVFAFPSIREFGGGVVLEAMALGLVPLIVDYAGPSELVTNNEGYKVPIGSRKSIVLQFEKKLQQLEVDRDDLPRLSVNARKKIIDLFTWQAKSKQILDVYKWVLNKNNNKPMFFDS